MLFTQFLSVATTSIAKQILFTKRIKKKNTLIERVILIKRDIDKIEFVFIPRLQINYLVKWANQWWWSKNKITFCKCFSFTFNLTTLFNLHIYKLFQSLFCWYHTNFKKEIPPDNCLFLSFFLLLLFRKIFI